jgi:hypothetical protein
LLIPAYDAATKILQYHQRELVDRLLPTYMVKKELLNTTNGSW